MSLASPHGEDSSRIGLSKNGLVRHIVDVSAPKFLRVKKPLSFCGVEIYSSSNNSDIPMCKKCVAAVRNLDKQIYQLKNLPNEKEVKKCMDLIISEYQPKLAQVIYLHQRKN